MELEERAVKDCLTKSGHMPPDDAVYETPSDYAPLSVNTVSTSSSASPAPSSSSLHNMSIPMSPNSDGGYNSGRDSTPSPALSVGHEEVSVPTASIKTEAVGVWRPF